MKVKNLKMKTDLTSPQYMADLPYDWFIATQVRFTVEDKTEVISKIIASVLCSFKCHRVTDDTIATGCTCYQSSAKRGGRDNIHRNIAEIEKSSLSRR